MLVQGPDSFVAGKGANQHQQGAFGQVKVGEQHVYHFEGKARRDEDARFRAFRAAGGPAF